MPNESTLSSFASRFVSRTHTQVNLAIVFALAIGVALVYWPSTVALDHLWRDTHEETYTHGYLILLLAIWLVARERKRLLRSSAEPAPVALLGVTVFSALWVFAYRATLQEPQLLLIPMILWTTIVATLGWRIAGILAFPIGYLYFAMPIWSDFNGLVQSLSAKMTGVLILLTGLPAFMQGDYVQLPRGEIEIAASCSGLHTLIVGLALAALYGKVAGVPLRRRWLWIAAMGALSLIVNWVRIFTVITAAYFTRMHSSLVRHHYWLGWWLFAGAFALFLWWTDRKSRLAHGEIERPTPSTEPNISVSTANRTAAAALWSSLTVIALLPLTSYGLHWIRTDATTSISIVWPADPTGWHENTLQGSEWAPHFVRPSAESRRRYTGVDGRTVDVFTVVYRVQTQDAKLLSYWNHLLAGDGHFRQRAERIVHSSTGPWRELRVDDASGGRSLLWVRYQIGARHFVTPRLSQLWYGVLALVNPPLSSLTALRTRCAVDCRDARARLAIAAGILTPRIY